jgi:hypothetical protein
MSTRKASKKKKKKDAGDAGNTGAPAGTVDEGLDLQPHMDSWDIDGAAVTSITPIPDSELFEVRTPGQTYHVDAATVEALREAGAPAAREPDVSAEGARVEPYDPNQPDKVIE